LLLDENREIRRLLDTERADIAHATREPGETLEGIDGAKELREVLVLADVDTALDALESEVPSVEPMSA